MGQDMATGCFKGNTRPEKSTACRTNAPEPMQKPKGAQFSQKEFKIKHLPDLKSKISSMETRVSHQNDQPSIIDDKQTAYRQYETRPSNAKGNSQGSNDNFMYRVPKGQISFESFNITHKIGSGTWGQVYLGELVDSQSNNNQRYAIKQMKKNKIFEKNLVDHVLMEKRVMQKIKNNFVTSVHYTFEDQLYCYLVMDQAKGGDVFSLTDPDLKRSKKFRQMKQQAVRFILGCVILGLEALHQKNICYNDLKPENLLVFQDGYVKLSDFGLSKHLRKNEKFYHRVGTPSYFSPEMVLRDGCNTSSDLWSLGILAYQLSNGDTPFSEQDIAIPNKFAGKVLGAQTKRDYRNVHTSEELKSLIDGLLRFDPKTRLGAKQFADLKGHQFFKDFSWTALENKRIQSPIQAAIKEDIIDYEKVLKEDVRPLFSMFSMSDELRIQGWSEESPDFE